MSVCSLLKLIYRILPTRLGNYLSYSLTKIVQIIVHKNIERSFICAGEGIMYVMVFLQHYISCLNYYVIVAYICLQIT